MSVYESRLENLDFEKKKETWYNITAAKTAMYKSSEVEIGKDCSRVILSFSDLVNSETLPW